MVGRYGMDQLNRFLLYAALALVIVEIFVHVRVLSWITILLLIVIYCRAFSRSIYKRQRENMKYLEIKAKFAGKFAQGGATRADCRVSK